MTTNTTTTPAPTAACPHLLATLIDIEGLGGFHAVEVYKCEDCGHVFRMAADGSDDGFAPDDDED